MNGRRTFLGSAVLGVAFASVMAIPASAHAAETALVHIDASVPVTLERFELATEAWELACSSPCDQQLPLGGGYRIVDAERPIGQLIQLRAAPGGKVTLTYKRTSTGAKVGGGLLVGFGSLLAAAGTVSLVGAILILDKDKGCSGGSTPYCGLGQVVGAIMAVVGGVGVLGGGGMILGGVSLLHGSGPSTKQHVDKDSYVREPTWSGPRAASTPRPAVFVPLSVSF